MTKKDDPQHFPTLSMSFSESAYAIRNFTTILNLLPLKSQSHQLPTSKPLVCETNYVDSSILSISRERMACATVRPSFSFHPSTSLSQPLPAKPRILLANPPLISKVSPNFVPQRAFRPQLTFYSTDVSKEDKPTSDQSDSSPQEPENFDKRRLEEKFAVLNTGIYECRSCGHKFDEAVGDSSYPIPPGLQFEKLPEDWRCPTCGAAKSFFVSKSVEIAGFAQNQQYGLGGNALTSGQKALLIYGSLLFFFALFLSGYFLQ